MPFESVIMRMIILEGSTLRSPCFGKNIYELIGFKVQGASYSSKNIRTVASSLDGPDSSN